MIKKKTKDRLNMFLLASSLLIIFGTHIYMLMNGLPQEAIKIHAILNLGAGLMFIGHLMLQRK